MAVPIRTTPPLEIGVPLRLFAIQGQWPWRDFDVSRDGQRFRARSSVMANEQPSRFGNEPCSRPSAFTRFSTEGLLS